MGEKEAILKMLIQVLKNQRVVLWAMHKDASDEEWKTHFASYVTETEVLLAEVMEE